VTKQLDARGSIPGQVAGAGKQKKAVAFEPVRRWVRDQIVDLIDSGHLGVRPIETHVVICGFPRSGSTLLLAMAEACFPDAKTFHKEKTAIQAARTILRNHSLMITKNPNDVFKIDQIREFYARRTGQVRFILTLRDPRAILTSTYENRTGYYWSVDGWWQMFHAFERARGSDDALVVRFEQLVSEPETVQGHFTRFIGREPVGRFDQFHARVPEGFDTRALNGVRPLDTKTIVKWQRPEHRQRIRDVLQEMPELPDMLVELGYETDTRWMQEYL
jgi:hypothetical protein